MRVPVLSFTFLAAEFIPDFEYPLFGSNHQAGLTFDIPPHAPFSDQS
jgi:hypothetical protein